MNEMWKKIGGSAILALALAVAIFFNAGQPKVITVAVIAFVVLMLGVWLLHSGKPKPIQGNAEQVIGNARRFLKAVARESDEKTLTSSRGKPKRRLSRPSAWSMTAR
jgi:hypothetical protein